MKPGKQKLGDMRGRFLQVVKNGQEMHDVDWMGDRILLSNRRFILADTGGRWTAQFSKIQEFSGWYDMNQCIAAVFDHFSVHIPSGVVLLTLVDYGKFETDFFGVFLNTEQFLVRHPAVASSVVQNTKWEKSRLKVETEAVNTVTAGGKFAEIHLDDIGDVKTGERIIADEHRSVIEVEYSDNEGMSLRVYIPGSDRVVSFLYTLLREGEEPSETSIELSETDKQALTALYSGVSPFDILNFLGLDVDEVEKLLQ